MGNSRAVDGFDARPDIEEIDECDDGSGDTEQTECQIRDETGQQSQTGENQPQNLGCLLYTSPSPRDVEESRMPSSA